MRIDGYSSAYVPNRTTRPDESEVYDLAQRQEEARAQQKAPEHISSATTVDSSRAVVQLANEFDWQQYQPREPMRHANLSYQAEKAIASYDQTARYSAVEHEATQMLGLDLYV